MARGLAVVAAEAALLAACGQVADVQVRAAPPVPPPAAAGPADVFQGEISSVDVAAGEFVLSVRILWAPVLEARAEDRRVVVGPGTRWLPSDASLAALQVGEDVQVKAHAGDDGSWSAVEVQRVDLD